MTKLIKYYKVYSQSKADTVMTITYAVEDLRLCVALPIGAHQAQLELMHEQQALERLTERLFSSYNEADIMTLRDYGYNFNGTDTSGAMLFVKDRIDLLVLPHSLVIRKYTSDKNNIVIPNPVLSILLNLVHIKLEPMLTK